MKFVYIILVTVNYYMIRIALTAITIS